MAGGRGREVIYLIKQAFASQKEQLGYIEKEDSH